MVHLPVIMMVLLPVIVLLSLIAMLWCMLKKRKTQARTCLLMFIFSSVVLIGFEQSDFWQLDRCLDSTAHYNYVQKQCEY